MSSPNTSQADAASVRLDGITKRYPGMHRAAVDDVDLEIRSGEFMTFLGPSGSGKSTVLGMIAGFTTATSGSISIAGEPVTSLPAHKRNLGMVFQNYALFPHLSVAQNVEFPLVERRVPKSERRARVADALAMVRLEEFAGRKPKQLSGGQQQRVALARALVFRPRLLLLDEPLGALDKRLREEMQTELSRIHREIGLTCVFVTHDQEEALALSDRIAVFSRGRIEQVGTAEELYERPDSLFVARFLGDSTVFPGVLAANGEVVTRAYGPLRGSAREFEADPGREAAVMVRPERMRLLDEHEHAEFAIAGTVSRIAYAGSSRKVSVELAGGETALVQETSGRVSGFREGDRVQVTWDAGDASTILGGEAPPATAAVELPALRIASLRS